MDAHMDEEGQAGDNCSSVELGTWLKRLQNMVDFFVFRASVNILHFGFRTVFFGRKIPVCWALQESFRGRYSFGYRVYYQYPSLFDHYPSFFRLYNGS